MAGRYSQAGYLGRLTLDQVLGVSQPCARGGPSSRWRCSCSGAASGWSTRLAGASMAAEPCLASLAAALMAAAVVVLVIGSLRPGRCYQQRESAHGTGGAGQRRVGARHADLRGRRHAGAAPGFYLAGQEARARFQQSIKPVYPGRARRGRTSTCTTSADRCVPLKRGPPGAGTAGAAGGAHGVHHHRQRGLGREGVEAPWVTSGVPNVYVLEGPEPLDRDLRAGRRTAAG